jgi:hypothetical protein
MDQRGTFIDARCHIGHRFSVKALSFAQFIEFERTLASALRQLSERIELCRDVAGTLQAQDPAAARRWEAAQRDSESQLDTLRTLLTREWIHPECEDAGPTGPPASRQT